MLRCVELGLSVADLDLLTVGLVTDMFLEKGNDSEEYDALPTQADLNSF